MSTRGRTQFEELLPIVDRTIALVCRRKRCPPDEAEDFASFVHLKLLETECGPMQRFEGRCQIQTFLYAVVYRMFLDYRRDQWGMWRPSTAARRQGATAVELERLVHRDGLTLEEALQTASGRGADGATRDELELLWQSLPTRPPRRVMVSDAALAGMSRSDEGAGDALLDEERRRRAGDVAAALKQVLGRLADEDATILRLHFEGDLTWARIAALMRLEPKPLYRRIERLLLRLRAELESRGFRKDEIASLVGSDGFAEPDGSGTKGPSRKEDE